MKFRNKFVSKRIGTKTLASLLAFGMALGSPMAVFADDGETAVVAENTVQAKKTDGSEVFVSVSDYVRGMMERGAVRLNDETGYLEDTSTGQKVDPETGERLTETPDVPETPAIPDNPGNEETPETPEDNQALYYSYASVKPGTPGNAIRQAMLDFAAQFIGNPYVWGGTSLTEGADCSGFVQQIYKNFGYNLPRVAEDQSQYGTKIPVEDAQPGDLIFYAKDGYVHHVVMYAGDGKTIEAANEDQGIISGTVYIPEAVWATRILEENYNLEGTDVNEQNATAEQYGDSIGEYTIDYYCSCETCRAKASKVKATGTPVVEGQTIAVDPDEIPYGTKVIIDGHVFTAEDYDTAGKEKHISIYVNEHETAQKLNEKKAEVHLVK